MEMISKQATDDGRPVSAVHAKFKVLFFPIGMVCLR